MSATVSRDDAHKDPATLEREIDQTRAEMNQTLTALEQKFSPGQLLDHALGLVKEHGGEFAGNLNQSIKQNPLPVILTTMGIAWMMMSGNRSSSTIRYDDSRYEPMEDFEGADSGLTGGVRGKIAEAGDRIKAGTEATRQKLASSKDAVASRLGRTTETAQAQAQRARQGFNQILEEQPLILGALGIALGAAIGAALPVSEQENRLLGPARDKAMSTLKERGAESYERVKGSVGQVAEEAKEKISNAARPSSGEQDREQQRRNPAA